MISIYCLKNSLNKKEKNLGYIRVDFYFFFLSQISFYNLESMTRDKIKNIEKKEKMTCSSLPKRKIMSDKEESKYN